MTEQVFRKKDNRNVGPCVSILLIWKHPPNKRQVWCLQVFSSILELPSGQEKQRHVWCLQVFSSTFKLPFNKRHTKICVIYSGTLSLLSYKTKLSDYYSVLNFVTVMTRSSAIIETEMYYFISRYSRIRGLKIYPYLILHIWSSNKP
jgi:hypothetical protein